ncbi:hypothetical protein [Nannocystis bainbridge]|uniref:Uncharacterized protein n=1 Tax=Nannocystis bainbridge TaxID=2995303 RepID=A0ABT5DRL9_9BACT|nr:hypothetical protein [Nannocystis bainbridge]MDC0716239.1 hypothetical protein [Nannocystis bainbridge]
MDLDRPLAHALINAVMVRPGLIAIRALVDMERERQDRERAAAAAREAAEAAAREAAEASARAEAEAQDRAAAAVAEEARRGRGAPPAPPSRSVQEGADGGKVLIARLLE